MYVQKYYAASHDLIIYVITVKYEWDTEQNKMVFL